MNTHFGARNRVELLMAIALVAGLSACGPQQVASPEADGRQPTLQPVPPRRSRSPFPEGRR
jgi:hypothetical protein